jgi:hypothetical protein
MPDEHTCFPGSLPYEYLPSLKFGLHARTGEVGGQVATAKQGQEQKIIGHISFDISHLSFIVRRVSRVIL